MNHDRAFRLLTRWMILCFAAFSAQQSLLNIYAQDLIPDTAKTPGLTIKVLEGENGVNIIKKKTAVKPVVEVRDENDLPVSGALVNFFLPDFSPTAGFAQGKKILMLTTDLTGKATVKDMVPIGEGKFTIRVTVTYQGKSATATIVQTNYLTASSAAAAGAAVATAATAKTGISGVLLGVIIGGAAAGGIVAATVLKGGDSKSSSTRRGTVGVGTGPTLSRP